MRLTVAIAALLIACHAPTILGGPTEPTTSHPCEQGGWCPNGFDCPPLGDPTGLCEYAGAPTAPPDTPLWRKRIDGGTP